MLEMPKTLSASFAEFETLAIPEDRSRMEMEQAFYAGAIASSRILNDILDLDDENQSCCEYEKFIAESENYLTVLESRFAPRH